MELSISKVRTLALTLRQLPARGLWPFTPDPAGPGLHVLASPAADAPLLVEGNSRHALDRLRRTLGPAGCRVLLLDTGGLDLYTAYDAGLLTLERVLAALPAPGTGEQGSSLNPAFPAEEDGADPSPLLGVHALLPYPLWQSLGAEQLATAGVQPGPARVEDLPAFLLGAPLTPRMQRPDTPLRERLLATTAHALLFLFVAALPLIVVGRDALLLATGIAAVAALANTLILPHLERRLGIRTPWWLPAGLLALLLGFFVVLGSTAGGLPPFQALFVGSSLATVSAWLGICCRRLQGYAFSGGR